MNKIITSVPKAIFNKGFGKAFLYSFGAFLAGWAIIWAQSPETAKLLGKWGVIIPLLNQIFVFAKQYFDALRNNN